MANYAGTQKQAQNSAFLQLGVPTQALRAGDTNGYIAGVDLPVGGAAFLSDINLPINQTAVATSSGSAQPFVGIVWRANQTASVDFYTQGYSQVVAQGLIAEVIQRGSVAINVTQQGATPVAPVYGDIVFVLQNGTFFTQATAGGTLPAGATQTNFRVNIVPSGFVAGSPLLISVTNRQNVGV